jgi:hypothetical protein
MITIEEPTDTITNTNKQYKIPTENFWTLIAWHKITHSETPLAISKYHQRAADIWNAIDDAKRTSGDEKLCWAADRLLLHILIDESGCERELFYLKYPKHIS